MNSSSGARGSCGIRRRGEGDGRAAGRRLLESLGPGQTQRSPGHADGFPSGLAARSSNIWPRGVGAEEKVGGADIRRLGASGC